jgi:hypothetical protein
MKPIAILALLALAACDQFPGIVGRLPIPTPAQICALSPATQAAIAAQLQTDLASMTAACEIINGKE